MKCPVSTILAAAAIGSFLPFCSLANIATNFHSASKGIIKVKAQLDAVTEAVEAEPVKLSPKTWADLTLIEAVPHGARVKKGDLLVRLDLDKLREQIEEMENDRPLSSLALEMSQAELESWKKTTPQRIEAAKRAARIADEDYTYFETTGRAARQKGSKFNVKSSEQRLMNATEELRQLEKMYKADQITEETEEIILKRQRYAVEAAEFYLKWARENAERELGTMIPRDEEALRTARRDQELALAFSEQTLPRTLSRKQLEVEKLYRDQRKAERKLADLRHDLDALSPRASMDGIVYYGACENGRWTTGALVGKKLVPGGKLLPNEILMTVVNPDKLRLRAVIAEADLGKYHLPMKGDALPVSAPDRKLAVTLDDLSVIPLPGGGFDASLSLARDKTVKVLPGMTCKVSFQNVQKPVSIALPSKAVFADTTQKFVFIRKADGTSEKRVVKTGESDETLTEITDGISEGDKVLLNKPEAKPEVKSET